MLQQVRKDLEKGTSFSDGSELREAKTGKHRGACPCLPFAGRMHSFSKNLLTVWVYPPLLGVTGPVGAKPRGRVPGRSPSGQRNVSNARLRVCVPALRTPHSTPFPRVLALTPSLASSPCLLPSSRVSRLWDLLYPACLGHFLFCSYLHPSSASPAHSDGLFLQ